MEVLVGAIIVVFVLVMGFRAFAGYSSYKGTLYQELFGSYLEYFWRMSMQRDLSKSSYLRERLGEHRIVYNAYRDGKGNIAATFATVFSTHGHAAICMVATAGAVAGKDTGSWTVERDGKRFALASPMTYVRRQKKLLDSFMKGAPIEYIIAFNKADMMDEAARERIAALAPEAHIVSAATGEGIEALRTQVESMLPTPNVHVSALLPYTAGSLLSRVREYGKVESVEYRGDGVMLEAEVDGVLAAQIVEQSIG